MVYCHGQYTVECPNCGIEKTEGLMGPGEVLVVRQERDDKEPLPAGVFNSDHRELQEYTDKLDEAEIPFLSRTEQCECCPYVYSFVAVVGEQYGMGDFFKRRTKAKRLFGEVGP